MRWFLGFVLGTVLSFGFLGIFTWANGTMPPPASDWMQVMAFPTGSAMTTFEIMWVIYVVSFMIVFSLAWMRPSSRGKGRRARPLSPMPPGSGTTSPSGSGEYARPTPQGRSRSRRGAGSRNHE